MKPDQDDTILELLARANEESPRLTTLNTSIVQPPIRPPVRAARSRPLLLAAAVVLAAIGIGSFFAIGELTPDSIQVGDEAVIEASAPEEPWLRMPAAFDRPRTADDVLSERATQAALSESPGAIQRPELDIDRSRKAIESEPDGIIIWLVPSVDDETVCLLLEEPSRGFSVSQTCAELDRATPSGVLGGASFTSFNTIFFGMILNDEVVDVVDAEVKDGVYLGIGPVVPQSSRPSEGPLPEAVFVYRDGSTGTQTDTTLAFVEVCNELWAQFFSGAQRVDRSAILSLEQVAVRTRSPLRFVVERLVEVARQSDDDVLVSSPKWSEAVPEGMALCPRGLIGGWEQAVIGERTAPEPEVDLAQAGVLLVEPGIAPESGGILGPLVTARREDDCIVVQLSSDFLDSSQSEQLQLACGIGHDVLTLSGPQNDNVVIGALVPPQVAYVAFELNTQQLAVRPVDGVVIYAQSGFGPNFVRDVRAFTAQGEEVDL